MSDNYKEEEKELETIINRNIKPKDETKKIKLYIYYKNKKLKQLFIKNGVASSQEDNNVVYQYTCSYAGCHSSKYIGYTTNLLTCRMKQHYYSGSIREHHNQLHDRRVTYNEILENTKVISRRGTKEELRIEEAILIKSMSPSINAQHEKFDGTLKIF
jgi:hypothetical protein